MAEKESGWTKPQADGVYWWRLNQTDIPDAVIVKGDVFYDFAETEPTATTLGEFLGPISPSDAEQLSELRKITEKTLSLKWLRNLSLNHRNGCTAITLYDNQCSCGLKDYLEIDDELRAALNPKPLEKETPK